MATLRAGLLVIVIALIATAMIPATGVREIHNTDRIFNFALTDPRPGPADWPWWRGSDGRNVAASDRVPLEWPSSGNEGWKITRSGQAQSMPCLWGDQLFQLTYDDRHQRVSLQSHSRTTGQSLWRTELHRDAVPLNDEKDFTVCTSPACDGQSIFCAAPEHGAPQISSVDFKGRIAWQRPAGPYSSNSGYRSSPVLFKSLVIVAVDQERAGYLAALHRQTGEIIWRVTRPADDRAGSPVVATIAGRSQLILSGRRTVSSYDPASGEVIWSVHWSADRGTNGVTFDDEHVFATSSRPESEATCIRANGTGDVTNSHIVWRQPKIACGLPWPVCRSGSVYILADDGRLTCLESSTGKIEWRKRLEGTFSASPIVAGEFLLCGNSTGLTSILRTDASGTNIAENQLPQGIQAILAAGNELLVVTRSGLHCIRESAIEPVVEKPDPLKRRI